jgi:hypothetical protein
MMKTVNAGSKVPLLGGRLSSAFGFNFTSQSTSDFTAAVRALTPGVNRPSTFPYQCVVDGHLKDCSTFGQSSSATSTYGWYVEPRLNMFERFFLSPGFRLDGGSASGGNAGLTGFPKIDLSYVAVNREGARPLGGILSMLRPRIAFGYAGVQPGPTDKLRLLSQCSGTLGCAQSQNITFDGTTFVSAEYLNTLGNTLLRPERSSEVEGGFDMDLWQDRVQFTGTHYDKVRHDAILSIPVAPSVYGGGQQSVNIGVIRNTGTELQLTGRVFESQAFSWDLSTIWSHNANRVVRLNPGFKSDYRNGIVAGYPLFSRWERPIVSFADVDGNGLINQGEVRVGDSSVYVGQQDPKYLMTVNSGVTLVGRLRIDASFAYRNGINQFNAGLGSHDGVRGFDLTPNAPGTTLATQAAVEALSGNYFVSGNGGVESTQIGLMQTVNELRWQSVSVSYVLPMRVAKVLRVPHTSVAVQGSNLWLHSNYRGKDPSVNAFSSGAKGDQVQDSGQLPQPRTWWLKFSLGN